MLKLVVLCAVLAVAFGREKVEFGYGSMLPKNPKIDPRVVNGEKAALGQFPYQVSLHRKGPLASAHYCGGSIISPLTILTAGHCVTEVQMGPFQHVEVLAGLISQANPGPNVQTRKVTKTIVHPDFPGKVAPNDVAIHILDSPLEFNDYVQPIALAAANSSEPTDETTLSGWGSTSHTQAPSYPDALMFVELPVVSHDECMKAVEGQGTPLDETMLCTGPLTGGFGACSGDSGGPLVTGSGDSRELVGIVSWGFIPCAQIGMPSVFTRVSAHREFIDANTV